MNHISKREDMGVAEAAREYLDECMTLQRHWRDQNKSVVVLDSGKLVASDMCWRTELQELMNMDTLCRRRFPALEWCSAPVDIIREALTDGDARVRDKEMRKAAGGDQQTVAKQILTDIVVDALEQNASDIHLRMTGSETLVAYRINGTLKHQPPRSRTSITEAVAAVLNTESEDFQSVFDEHSLSAASITLKLPAMHHEAEQEVRIRAQKSPCRGGFTVTLRLQAARNEEVPDVIALGFSPESAAKLRELMQYPAGLILISGPTGHGKTTSLAAMNRFVPRDRKIISLEDPIEIIQPDIEQKFVPTDMNPQAFAEMVKVVMREDPDIIEVSEIRDISTAKSSITAALTGHLVLSTIHANSSLGIISRLIDLGVCPTQLSQPDLIAGLIAQRLIPELCKSCRKTGTHPVWQECARACPEGCSECGFSGISGRVLVSEVVMPDSTVANLISNRDFASMKVLLQQSGWCSMATETLRLIRELRVDPFMAIEIVPGLMEEQKKQVTR